DTLDGKGIDGLAGKGVHRHLQVEVVLLEVPRRDGRAGGLVVSDHDVVAVCDEAVDVAAQHVVVIDVEGERELDGWSLLRLVGDKVVLDKLVHVPDDGADKVLAGLVVIERLPRATDTFSIAKPRCFKSLADDGTKSVLAIHAEGEILVPMLQCRGVMPAEDKMVGLVEGLPALYHLVVILPAALGGEFER